MVRAGDAQMWFRGDSAVVTVVRALPNRRECHLWLAAGAMDDLIALTYIIEEWARSVGCDRLTLSGRRGWERVGQAHGWDYHLTLLCKDL